MTSDNTDSIPALPALLLSLLLLGLSYWLCQASLQYLIRFHLELAGLSEGSIMRVLRAYYRPDWILPLLFVLKPGLAMIAGASFARSCLLTTRLPHDVIHGAACAALAWLTLSRGEAAISLLLPPLCLLAAVCGSAAARWRQKHAAMQLRPEINPA